MTRNSGTSTNNSWKELNPKKVKNLKCVYKNQILTFLKSNGFQSNRTLDARGSKCKVSLDCIDKFPVPMREKALPENPIAHERLVEEIRIETIQIKRSRSE
jgi:hypothetical protein